MQNVRKLIKIPADTDNPVKTQYVSKALVSYNFNYTFLNTQFKKYNEFFTL